ncbi:hypothetical protein GCM10023149_11460 [Mucilaginibacter gynuensis]|uniref:Glycerophosphoryl diester phosphodiesterase membrane domain-containing protein n=1 Tax=Mucilaginibacter gynuensis TaxID=1302236 RepID=A0ABP8G0V1_9SPHI
MYHPFSVIETIKTSWDILRKNFIPLIIYSVITLLIYKGVKIVTFIIFPDDDELLNNLTQIFAQMIVQTYLTLSFYKLILTLMDRAYYEFEFKDILPSLRMAFNFIVICIGFGILIAFLIFINLVLSRQNIVFSEVFTVIATLGLLYMLLRSIFCVCFIIDDDSKPLESLKQSFEITKDNFFKTLGIALSILVIMIITLIPINIIITFLHPSADADDYVFVLGYYAWFAIAFPAVQVIIMVTYRKLVYSHLDVDDDIAETN